jgi:hypothetical protein
VDRAEVAQVLAAMATHFTGNRPDALLTKDALTVCAGAEVYNATGRSVLRGGSALVTAVTAVLPLPEPGTTRARYAARLLMDARAYGWSDDDNEPVIPRFPHARPAPAPAPRPGVPGPRPATGRSGK